jgi:hypothetical protein
METSIASTVTDMSSKLSLPFCHPNTVAILKSVPYPHRIKVTEFSRVKEGQKARKLACSIVFTYGENTGCCTEEVVNVILEPTTSSVNVTS